MKTKFKRRLTGTIIVIILLNLFSINVMAVERINGAKVKDDSFKNVALTGFSYDPSGTEINSVSKERIKINCTYSVDENSATLSFNSKNKGLKSKDLIQLNVSDKNTYTNNNYDLGYFTLDLNETAPTLYMMIDEVSYVFSSLENLVKKI